MGGGLEGGLVGTPCLHGEPVGIPPGEARGVRGVGGTKRNARAIARNLLERHAYRLTRARICARFSVTL